MLKPTLVLALAAAVLSTGVSAQEAESASFKRQSFSVGHMIRRASSMKMNMSVNVSMGGEVIQSQDQVQQGKKRMTIEILAEAAGAPSKVKVVFDELSESVSVAGQDMSEDSPAAGKTYIVELKDGEFVVTDEAGAAVTETDVVLSHLDVKDRGSLNFAGEFHVVVPEGAMAAGNVIEVDTETAKKLMDFPSGLSAESLTLTFKGKKKMLGVECGEFDLAMKLIERREQGPVMKLDLTGTAMIGMDTTWLHQLVVKGPLSMKGEMNPEGAPAPLELEGSGDVDMSALASYEAPKKP